MVREYSVERTPLTSFSSLFLLARRVFRFYLQSFFRSCKWWHRSRERADEEAEDARFPYLASSVAMHLSTVAGSNQAVTVSQSTGATSWIHSQAGQSETETSPEVRREFLEHALLDSTCDVNKLHAGESTACAICLDEYEPGSRISQSFNRRCKHRFHHECILDWLMNDDTCPCCRQNFLEFCDDGGGESGETESSNNDEGGSDEEGAPLPVNAPDGAHDDNHGGDSTHISAADASPSEFYEDLRERQLSVGSSSIGRDSGDVDIVIEPCAAQHCGKQKLVLTATRHGASTTTG